MRKHLCIGKIQSFLQNRELVADFQVVLGHRNVVLFQLMQLLLLSLEPLSLLLQLRKERLMR